MVLAIDNYMIMAYFERNGKFHMQTITEIYYKMPETVTGKSS